MEGAGSPRRHSPYWWTPFDTESHSIVRAVEVALSHVNRERVAGGRGHTFALTRNGRSMVSKLAALADANDVAPASTNKRGSVCSTSGASIPLRVLVFPERMDWLLTLHSHDRGLMTGLAARDWAMAFQRRRGMAMAFETK